MGIFKRSFRFKYNPEAVTEEMARCLNGLKKNSPVRPRRLFVYPTCLCNDKCAYCSDGLNNDSPGESRINYDRKRDFFSDKGYIDRLVKDIRTLKIADVHLFGGGEPFFYKENMFYFLEKLRDTDVFIRIITNANGLEKADIERIVRGGLISQLNISLNTDSENTAEKLYSDASRHRHTMEVLRWITECKASCKTEFPKVDIMFIVLKVNYDRIIEIIESLEGREINYFFFQPLRVYSEKQKAFALSPAEQEALRRQVPEIEKALDRFKIRSNIAEFKGEERVASGGSPAKPAQNLELRNKHGAFLQCYMPLTTVSICYNGNIPFCQFKYDKQYGSNYFEIKGLEELLKSGEYSAFTANFISGSLPEVCGKCNFCVPHELNFIRERMLHPSRK